MFQQLLLQRERRFLQANGISHRKRKIFGHQGDNTKVSQESWAYCTPPPPLALADKSQKSTNSTVKAEIKEINSDALHSVAAIASLSQFWFGR